YGLSSTDASGRSAKFLNSSEGDVPTEKRPAGTSTIPAAHSAFATGAGAGAGAGAGDGAGAAAGVGSSPIAAHGRGSDFRRFLGPGDCSGIACTLVGVVTSVRARALGFNAGCGSGFGNAGGSAAFGAGSLERAS